MEQCRNCTSYAINPTHHGRDGKSDLALCDVCYWRKRAAARLLTLKVVNHLIEEAKDRDDYPDLEAIKGIIERELSDAYSA